MKSFWVIRASYRSGFVQRFYRVVRPCYAVAISAALILIMILLGVLL